MKIYTKQDFNKELKSLDKIPEELLYNEKIINNYGKLKEDDTYTTELVIKYLLDKKIIQGDAIRNIEQKHRQKSYRIKSHEILSKIINKNSNRTEENLVKKLLKENTLEKDLGKSEDYQVPLKTNIHDKVGKIDLLTYKADSNELFLVEVKKEKSKETLLRAILEIQTYFQIVDQEKLKKDFEYESATMRKAIAVPKNSQVAKEFEEINSKSRANLQKLIKLFNIEVVVF